MKLFSLCGQITPMRLRNGGHDGHISSGNLTSPSLNSPKIPVGVWLRCNSQVSVSCDLTEVNTVDSCT